MGQKPLRHQADGLREVSERFMEPIESIEDHGAAIVRCGVLRVEVQAHRQIRQGLLGLPGGVECNAPDKIDLGVAIPAVNGRGQIGGGLG